MKKILPNFKNFCKIKKLPWILARNAFLAILIFIILDVILGGVLLYKYANPPEDKNLESLAGSFKFDKEAYQKVLNRWQKNQQELESILQKNYKNPF